MQSVTLFLNGVSFQLTPALPGLSPSRRDISIDPLGQLMKSNLLFLYAILLPALKSNLLSLEGDETMAIPGFSAEASLATTSGGRWIVPATRQKPSAQSIVPQKYPEPDPNTECDIYIVCVDGIRYLVRDCPDGSGDETRIGVCPPRPWWAQPFHYWIKHPWFIRG
jgi:hypothetical protein